MRNRRIPWDLKTMQAGEKKPAIKRVKSER